MKYWIFFTNHGRSGVHKSLFRVQIPLKRCRLMVNIRRRLLDLLIEYEKFDKVNELLKETYILEPGEYSLKSGVKRAFYYLQTMKKYCGMGQFDLALKQLGLCYESVNEPIIFSYSMLTLVECLLYVKEEAIKKHQEKMFEKSISKILINSGFGSAWTTFVHFLYFDLFDEAKILQDTFFQHHAGDILFLAHNKAQAGLFVEVELLLDGFKAGDTIAEVATDFSLDGLKRYIFTLLFFMLKIADILHQNGTDATKIAEHTFSIWKNYLEESFEMPEHEIIEPLIYFISTLIKFGLPEKEILDLCFNEINLSVPNYNYVLSKVYEETGNTQKAAEYFNKACFEVFVDQKDWEHGGYLDVINSGIVHFLECLLADQSIPALTRVLLQYEKEVIPKIANIDSYYFEKYFNFNRLYDCFGDDSFFHELFPLLLGTGIEKTEEFINQVKDQKVKDLGYIYLAGFHIEENDLAKAFQRIAMIKELPVDTAIMNLMNKFIECIDTQKMFEKFKTEYACL